MSANAALYFVDRHLDEGRGDKTAYQEVDGAARSLTFAQLSEQSGRFAGALARYGVRREERMAMIVLDQIEFPIAFWGAIKAGVVPIPLNTMLPTSVYAGILADSRASVLLVSSALWDTVRPALEGNESIRHVILVGDEHPGTLSEKAFMRGADCLAPVSSSGDELAFWLYSSGSTGLPKGVRHLQASMQATAETFGRDVLGLKEDDIVFSVAKLFFAYGLGNAMSFPLSVGATTLLFSGRPTPDAMFDIMKSRRPTIFCGVPTLFAALVAAQEAAGGLPDHAIRLCTSAGEALPREVGERWQRLWGAEIVDGVGSTEMLHIFLSNRPGDVDYGTSGRPVPGYQARLVDEHDQEVAVGEVGELLVSGPSSAEGYWNRRDKSLETFEGRWTRTGDKYERREDGRYIYCGRTDDMFKVSGIWVSPFEIEQALIEHPAVLEAAVVAKADDDELIKPAAYIVLKEGADPSAAAELKDFVKAKIGNWKYPRWVTVVDDLPKTATGKIQRFKLREGA